MAFTPFSGVQSRVTSGVIAPVSSTDLVVPLGTEVKTNMLEHVSWSVSRPREGGSVLSAGCPVDAQGNVYKRKLRGGVVNPTISLEGVYNGDSAGGASSDSRFTVGAFIVFNVLFHATGLWGYYSLVGVVKSSGASTKMAGDPAAFKCEIEIDGSFPAPSTS